MRCSSASKASVSEQIELSKAEKEILAITAKEEEVKHLPVPLKPSNAPYAATVGHPSPVTAPLPSSSIT